MSKQMFVFDVKEDNTFVRIHIKKDSISYIEENTNCNNNDPKRYKIVLNSGHEFHPESASFSENLLNEFKIQN